ncbi:MAG: alpha/beta hydrolase family protein [Phycisphaerales bacterium JB065]
MSHPGSIVRCAIALLFSLLFLPLAGCWFAHGGSRDRATGVDVQTLEPIVWPRRDMEEIRKVSEDTPDALFEYRITDASLVSSEAIAEAESPVYRILANRLTEHGLLRVFEERFDSEIDRRFAAMFEGFAPNARFVSSCTLSSKEEAQHWIDRLAQARPDSPGTERTFDKYRHRIRDGVAIYLPDPETKPSPRGIVLHFRGLISTSYEEAFVNKIVESDWLVVRVGTHTRIVTPRDERQRQRYAEQERRRNELTEEFRAGLDPDDPMSRYAPIPVAEIFEQARRELPPIETGFDLPDHTESEAVGEQIARAVDDALAESAYAAEAALEYLYETNPETRGLPVVVLGCSAGAISVPAVAARIDERFGDRLSALVMIGGGADVMEIDRDTALDGTRRLRVFGPDDAEVAGPVWDTVHEAYLKSVQLDAIAVGPRLRHVPTLIIRAGFDKWVPASTGSELVRVFGKPDRDWHPGGHQTLFYFLAGRAPRVLRWMEKNTPEPETLRADTVSP